MTSMIETHPKLQAYRELFERFHKNIPVDVFALCKELKPDIPIRVEIRDDMPGTLSGFILKKNGKCYIFCNGNEPKTRQRFTLAHELAHYLLHWDKIGEKYPENFLLRGGLPNEDETEANQLAADILMPQSKVHEYINSREEVSMTKMAKDFNVSRQALSIRLGIPLKE